MVVGGGGGGGWFSGDFSVLLWSKTGLKALDLDLDQAEQLPLTKQRLQREMPSYLWKV